MPRATILIIEDHPLNMELIADLLETHGYVVLQAEDAESGIALAKEERPAIVLMDVGLPGMDGLTATSILKAEAATKEIPVIALTAHAMKEDEEKALAAGCDGYIRKPVDTRTLPEMVARFVPLGQGA
jgi:CheY-like chemotaxis protein